MKPKEKVMVIFLGLVVLGAVGYLLFFAPIGSLDGQSLEVDRFSILGFIALCSVGGYIFIHWQGKRQ